MHALIQIQDPFPVPSYGFSCHLCIASTGEAQMSDRGGIRTAHAHWLGLLLRPSPVPSVDPPPQFQITLQAIDDGDATFVIIVQVSAPPQCISAVFRDMDIVPCAVSDKCSIRFGREMETAAATQALCDIYVIEGAGAGVLRFQPYYFRSISLRHSHKIMYNEAYGIPAQAVPDNHGICLPV